jgi:hypothetical protein
MPRSRYLFSAAIVLGLAPALHADQTLDRIRKDVFYLASDECEGRGLKTDGINKAADYIVRSFKAAGVKPAMPDGSYFQPFTIKESYLEAGPHRLTLTGPDGKELDAAYNKAFCVCGMSAKGTVGGGVVFAGYGIAAERKYDDYADVDVANKVVIILRQNPRVRSKESLFTDAEARKYAPLVAKVDQAAKRGAAAVIFLNDRDMAGKEDPLMGYDYAKDDGKPAPIPVLQAKRELIDRLLAPGGKSLAEIEAEIDETRKPKSFEVTGWSAKVQTSIAVRDLAVKNVIACLDGAGPLANETVIVGAHYDHLGRGERGTKDLGNTAIHYGADDNASGTAALLELARRYGGQMNREGRRLVFIAFTGEERGLFGSLHYCDNPPFPLKGTVAMLNMDMVGRVRADEKSKKDKLVVGGVGSAKNFEKLLDETNRKFDFQLEKSKSGTGPSDHTSFYLSNVPVYFFFSGDHPEYHTPKDRPETINVAGIAKVTDLVEQMATSVATAKERPEYVPGMGSSMSGGAGGGPKLGVMPQYDDAETRGMGIGGVVPGGAAEAAGLKKGDRITAIAGKPVKNVQDYMKEMSGLKRGDPVELTIERDGKSLKITATPR